MNCLFAQKGWQKIKIEADAKQNRNDVSKAAKH